MVSDADVDAPGLICKQEHLRMSLRNTLCCLVPIFKEEYFGNTSLSSAPKVGYEVC
jgi:hypothetical protein